MLLRLLRLSLDIPFISLFPSFLFSFRFYAKNVYFSRAFFLVLGLTLNAEPLLVLDVNFDALVSPLHKGLSGRAFYVQAVGLSHYRFEKN